MGTEHRYFYYDILTTKSVLYIQILSLNYNTYFLGKKCNSTKLFKQYRITNGIGRVIKYLLHSYKFNEIIRKFLVFRTVTNQLLYNIFCCISPLTSSMLHTNNTSRNMALEFLHHKHQHCVNKKNDVSI